MKTQTGAILLDAYRELHARKMFWIVLILSLLVIAAFAMLGVTDNTLTILWWTIPGDLPDARLVYKTAFSTLIIGFYLTWVAAILALISTASIFPEFLTGGAIDLYLSKPIGRGQLFLTKYLAGLLFVTLQVAVFAFASFLVMGLRGHSWEPSLFLAIPIVVVFFSYLYGICVLMGMLTRSAMAALLLTMLAWFFIWTIDRTDVWLTSQTQGAPLRQRLALRESEQLGRRIATLEKHRAAETQRHPTTVSSTSGREPTADADFYRLRMRRDRLAAQAAEAPVPPWMDTTQKVVLAIKTFVPKTRETTALLDRYLLPQAEIEAAADNDITGRGAAFARRNIDPTRGRSVWWVVGTSVAFEAAMIAISAWLFRRRDF